MARNAAFVYDDSLSRHSLSESHPMKPERLRYTYEILNAYGAFEPSNSMMVEPRLATEQEVLSYHTEEYLRAVERLSRGEMSSSAATFNFGPGDNPVYEGIYEAALRSTGASMRAVELLESGEAGAAFSISGGLHHAMPAYAYGFCVFNDPAIAINTLVARGARVAYVDIDCHHGDGVQHAFYDTDQVLTVSLHESGAFLFPGTGFTQETGAGKGKSHSVNLPLYPYTSDEVYLWAFKQVVPPLIEAFRPDVLVTQLGIDSHYLDSLTHLGLTVQGFEQAVAELAKIAPDRWLALGGGGYDLQAVARAWALAFGVMSSQSFDEQVPGPYRDKYGVAALRDSGSAETTDAIEKSTRVFAEASVQAVQQLIFPAHGITAG